MSEDDAIRATNDDAASCKKWAIDKGYFIDPYLKHFVRNCDRKAPEISLGYFVRIKSIQTLLRNFLRVTNCKSQVVNLGAGFDTTFWNIADEGVLPSSFVEIDFTAVTSRKCYYIKSKKELLEKLGNDVTFTPNAIHSPKYHLIGADLRNLEDINKQLLECSIDMNLPTIFIAECVLVYMSTEDSTKLLKWIAQKFSCALFISYEQVNMADQFGNIMVENLKVRGCGLAGVDACKSLETQRNRFLSVGWHGTEACDLLTLYRSLAPSELTRIESLELLDEKELLSQLLEHYCLVWAYKDLSNRHNLQSITLQFR